MSRRGRYDLVVLGGGTGGLVSAFVAAGIGARVALVERERTGGDCLWTGCVPSKSLLAAARLAHRMRHADAVGLSAVEPAIDFAAVMDRVHAAIAEIEPHDSPARLRGAGVEVIEGDGRFLDDGTLEVGSRRLRFAHAIIATGAAPVLPPVDGLTGDDVLTTDTVWDLRERPGRLIVLGGGPIGCELGQAFARLGSEVTIVEATGRLLGHEEPDASALVADRLRAEGIDVRTGVTARAVQRDGDGARLLLDDGSAPAFDRLLVAAGRAPRTAGIGLDAAGVQTGASGEVRVDARLRTTARRIFAVGDVTAQLPFTHVAAHHARVATINALFGARREVSTTIPWVTFCDPEVARVGLTAAQARERDGDRARIASYDYATLDRAVTEGERTGFATLVGDRRGRLVGATVVGAGAGEAIAELSARVAAGDRIDDVSSAVHAYPTFAEGPARAANAYLRERFGAPGWRHAARPVLLARRLLA